MASAARSVSNAAQALPALEPGTSRPAEAGSSRPRLDVVERRRAAARSVRRRVNLLRGLGVMFVVGALAVTAAAHTFVASDQQRIDALQNQLTQALAAQQDLQLARAELESPPRVLVIAERRLGMVSPESVTYLAPVDPGPSVSEAAASRAALAVAAAAQKAEQVEPAKSAKSDVLAGKTQTRTSLAGARSSGITPPTG